MNKFKQFCIICLTLFLCFGVVSAKKLRVQIERTLEVDGVNYILFKGLDGAYVSYKSDGYAGDIIIPKNITVGNQETPIVGILDGVFKENKNLRSLEFKCDIYKLRSYEFFHCSSLEKIVLNEGIRELEDNVFCECHNLVDINIPAGMKYIDDYAFSDCYNITNVTLPEGLLYLGKHTFYKCYNLKSIDLPDSLERVKEGTFEDCINLRNVSFGNGILRIGKRAFFHCVDLSSPNFPEGLCHLGDKAFSRCSSIDDLTIPYFVKYIGWDTFEYCTNLKQVRFQNSNPPEVREAAFYLPRGFKGAKIPILVPEEGLGKYKSKLRFKFGYAKVDMMEID